MTTGKVMRALVGLAVLLVIFVMVNGWWSEYKESRPSKESAEATSTAPATQTAEPAGTGQTALILVDGLNFREQPDATGASIRGLKKGEQFTVISINGSWLELKDASSKVGWVNNNPQYVRIQK